MKIRIDKDVPVNAVLKPVVGRVYRVRSTATAYGRNVYTIRVYGVDVNVLEHECTVVEE